MKARISGILSMFVFAALLVVCLVRGAIAVAPYLIGTKITSSSTHTKTAITIGDTTSGGVQAAKLYETDGTAVMGAASPAPGAVTGFIWVPMATSTPTGTPSPVQSGMAAVVVSSGDHKIYTWDGSGWTGR